MEETAARNPILRRWWHRLTAVVELDLRSLALLRMGLGVIIVADLLVALTNAEAFYSDAGTMPLSLLKERAWHHPWAWSLHAWHGSVLYQQLLLAIALSAAVAFTFGWRTRWMTLVSWLLWCSLETRNPEVVNGADPVIRLLLFWGIFLPLGAVWSVDGQRRPAGRPMTVRSVPCFCLMVQIAVIYWFSAILKTDPSWGAEGTAVWQVMHADTFARPTAVWLRLFPEVCEWITRATISLEKWAPWLIFVPFGRTAFRMLAIALFWGFHLGIQFTMDIGSFPLMMLVAWSALIPTLAWELGARLLKKPAAAASHEPIMPLHWCIWVRDGWCLLCLAYILMWNLRTTDFQRWEPWFSRKLNGIGFALRLDQFWTMFAPFPWLDDGWPILAARLVDGSEVDLLNDGKPVTMEKPALCSSRYKDSRWQKYLGNLWMKNQAVHRDYLARYLARRWDASHGTLQQVEKWELVYMLERTRKDGKGIEPVRKHVIARSVEGMK